MEATKITAEKKDAYKIREVAEQAIFRKMLFRYPGEIDEQVKSTLSRKSKELVNALMNEPKIEIILKRRKNV
jgi:hypothetical protein